MSHVPFYVLSLGLAPLCENMPSGKANKPGDVVRAKNGKTIQVREGTREHAICYHPAAARHECRTPAALWARVLLLVLRTFSWKVPLVLMEIFEYFSFHVVSPTNGAIHINHDYLAWPAERDTIKAWVVF